mmetsp:Transcript_6494/g.8569  ORF Transcript_6494/g.8569 Transcript_6494/m.8569 type:complete len:83 (+) Transcript_6494:119-367(+)
MTGSVTISVAVDVSLYDFDQVMSYIEQGSVVQTLAPWIHGGLVGCWHEEKVQVDESSFFDWKAPRGCLKMRPSSWFVTGNLA